MVPKWCPDVKNKVVKRKTATITRYKKSLCLQGFSQITYKKICGNTGRFWLFHDPRNQVVAQAARGFESHPIRHIAGAKFALLRLFYARISSLCAFGDFPVAFKAAALRQNKPCLPRLRRGYLGAVVEMGITVDEGIAGGYVAFN